MGSTSGVGACYARAREELITDVLGALDKLKIDPSRIVASKA
jgi:hypothetical protein